MNLKRWVFICGRQDIDRYVLYSNVHGLPQIFTTFCFANRPICTGVIPFFPSPYTCLTIDFNLKYERVSFSEYSPENQSPKVPCLGRLLIGNSDSNIVCLHNLPGKSKKSTVTIHLIKTIKQNTPSTTKKRMIVYSDTATRAQTG